MTENVTRRRVLEAAGASVAAASGVPGSAAAGPMECVATTTDAGGSSSCGSPAETIIESGRSGYVRDSCTSDGVEYDEVEFDCSETWWVKSSDLESANDCFC